MAEKKFLDLDGLSAVLAKVKTAINDAKAEASAPKATASSLGIVKPGTGLNVDSDGTLTVNANEFATVDKATEVANSAAASKVAEIVGGAGTDFDTLKEIETWIGEHGDLYEALVSTVGAKANADDVYTKTLANSTFVMDSNLTALTATEINSLCDTALK